MTNDDLIDQNGQNSNDVNIIFEEETIYKRDYKRENELRKQRTLFLIRERSAELENREKKGRKRQAELKNRKENGRNRQAELENRKKNGRNRQVELENRKKNGRNRQAELENRKKMVETAKQN